MGEEVELQVSNLDPLIDHREVKHLVTALFSEYVKLLRVDIYRQEGGGLGAVVKLSNDQDAKVAISQLHKRKIGSKRIAISYLPTDVESLPRKEIVTLLQSVPGGKILLFKFRQMYEERFRSCVSVSDLHRMKDVVTLYDDVGGSGRMIQLNSKVDVGLNEVEMLMCEEHYPKNNIGWAENRIVDDNLPLVHVGLNELSSNVKKLLDDHGGSLPLASLIHCYSAEFGPLNVSYTDDGKNGVVLEHLLQAVRGILVITGATGIKKLIEATPDNCAKKNIELVGPPPALASQLITFTREVVDMLKAVPGCKVPFYKFIPRYHHHFGKQCRVADYGYTKLRDLLESLPHVVHIVGEGSKPQITLAHKAQVRRFTNDLLKMLKNQPDKQFLLSSFCLVFERTFFKPLNVYDYGVCYLDDIFSEIPDNTISREEICSNGNPDFLISVYRRDQTQEEVMRTRGFAKEVIELLRHLPNLSICFNKFIPAYHQHFGRQCRVGSYGMSKLIELFEAIPDTVEIKDEGDDRLVLLTKDKMIWVVGEQIEGVVKASRARSVDLADLEEEYLKMFGHNLPLLRLNVTSVNELVELLQSWVRVVDGKEGKVLVTVDRGYIRTMAHNVRKLLIEQANCEIDIDEFIDKMASRFGSQIGIEMLTRDLSYLVEVKDEKVSLTALQTCARDIELVLGDVGKLPVAELDSQYEAKFGRELPLEPLGFDTVNELLVAMNDTLIVRGRGIRKIVSINKNTSTSLISPSRPSMIFSSSQSMPSEVAAFSGRGFDMLRMVTPQSVSRSYSGAVQASDTRHRSCPASNVQMYSIPPPAFHKNLPPLASSPQTSSNYPSRHSHIPSASPNSPSTPTTPRSFNFSYPMYHLYTPSVYTSSYSTSPVPTATFQQHMLHHSPSPLITSSRTPYIVQPISRVPSQVGFYPKPNVGLNYDKNVKMDVVEPVGGTTSDYFNSRWSQMS